jgi:tetratricopeptide (TPR) repeat protein
MKSKRKPKATKKASGRATNRKSLGLKAKSGKASGRDSRNGSKPPAKTSRGRSKSAKVEERRAPATRSSSPRAATSERGRAKHYNNAIEAYETALKLMHSEQFEKAIRCFEELVGDHPEEPEIQERAKVLIHACEKKMQERARTVLRSADDHYNVAIAELNRRELGAAIEHLRHALKLMPKADHIFYALATANALQGNREDALQNLKQSIHYRAENRFLAARDSDFESLRDDAEFRQLVTPPEK